MHLQKYYALQKPLYIEKTFNGSRQEYLDALSSSATIYVSNIPESTREERLWLLFGLAGRVKRVIPGINKGLLTFCGFCFVEYANPADADTAIDFFEDFSLDGKILRADKDVGFTDGRQYGRGIFGGAYKKDIKRRR